MAVKQCSKCKIIKDVSEFYHPPSMGGRITSHCKRCQIDAVANRRKNKPGYKPRVLHIHKDLISNYFETIDTIEKAYWLGFIFADGYITKDGLRLQIHLSIKDESLMDDLGKAVGANLEFKRYYGPYKTSGKSVMLTISNNAEFVQHIINLGCVNAKSKIIRLPRFNSRNLNLAFLLGYYDGDGAQNSTKICCGSRKFLQDIKKLYNLKYKITKQKNHTYTLSLGSILFKEMISIYSGGLKRKRKSSTYQKRPYNPPKLKFYINPDELKSLVWEIPITQLAKILNVSGNAVHKRCKKYGIKTPQRGYWRKIRTGTMYPYCKI